MVPLVLAGTVVWGVVGLILLAERASLTAQGRENWLWICLAGFLFGVAGLLLMRRHDANRRRRLGRPSTPGGWRSAVRRGTLLYRKR